MRDHSVCISRPGTIDQWWIVPKYLHCLYLSLCLYITPDLCTAVRSQSWMDDVLKIRQIEVKVREYYANTMANNWIGFSCCSDAGPGSGYIMLHCSNNRNIRLMMMHLYELWGAIYGWNDLLQYSHGNFSLTSIKVNGNIAAGSFFHPRLSLMAEKCDGIWGENKSQSLLWP